MGIKIERKSVKLGGRNKRQINRVRPGKWQAFQNGDVTLQDFVHQHQDDTFGQMVTEASLSGALKGK
jgi:hypothetical protein